MVRQSCNTSQALYGVSYSAVIIGNLTVTSGAHLIFDTFDPVTYSYYGLGSDRYVTFESGSQLQVTGSVLPPGLSSSRVRAAGGCGCGCGYWCGRGGVDVGIGVRLCVCVCAWWHDGEKMNINVGYVPPSESIPVSTWWTALLKRVSLPEAPSTPFCFCFCFCCSLSSIFTQHSLRIWSASS